MDVVASNPENGTTAEKAHSDSENTGSHDFLNVGFSNGESQTSDKNAVAASPFKQSKIAGTSEKHDNELALSHDSQPANSLNMSGDANKQQESAIENDYVSTAIDTTETSELKNVIEATKAFEDDQKDASSHEESTTTRRRSHVELKARKVLSGSSATSSPVRKKVHQTDKIGENENHDQVEQSRDEDKSGNKIESENQERAVQQDTTASESKKEIGGAVSNAASNSVSVKEGQKFSHQESENEDSENDDGSEDEEEEDRKAKMLKNVKDYSKAKKRGSLEFKFAVGPDIFDLGLDNSNLYCGVVITLKKKDTELFYPGEMTSLNIAERKLEMVAFVPPSDVKDEEDLMFNFAVSESVHKNVVLSDSMSIRVSQSGTKTLLASEGEVFSDLEKTQTFASCAHADQSTFNYNPDPQCQLLHIKNQATESPVEASLITFSRNTGGSSNLEAKQTQMEKMSTQINYPENPLVSEGTKTDRLFSAIKDSSKFYNINESTPYWCFKFEIGVEALNHGLSTPVYCGVLVLTKKAKFRNGKFFPGTKVSHDNVNCKLEMEVIVPKKEISANIKFSYSYAISESEDCNVFKNNPELLARQQKFIEVTVSDLKKNEKVIDDRNKDISFKRCESKSAATTSVKATRRTLQELAETKDISKDVEDNDQDESETSDADDQNNFNRNKSVENGFSLQDILCNSKRDSLHDDSAHKFTEINVIVGSDLCSFGQKKLLVGVRTSLDNFKKTTPGHIVGSIEDYVWIRVLIETGSHCKFDYKYVAENPKTKKIEWEQMHQDGEINRRISQFNGKKIIKYDGLVSFFAQSDLKKSEGWFSKVVGFFKESTDKRKTYYGSQNSIGLGIYLRYLFQQLLRNEFDVDAFRKTSLVVLKTLSQINAGTSNYVSTLELMSVDEIILTVFKLFLLIFDTYQINGGEFTESHECQMAVVALFTLIEAYDLSISTLDSVPEDVYEKFLRSALFLTDASEHALADHVSQASSLNSAVKNVCYKLLSVKAIQKNKLYPVLIEWLTMNEKAIFINLNYALKVNTEVVESLRSYYTSKSTRRQLLLVYFRQNWTSCELIKNLNLPVDEIVNCYYYRLSRDSNNGTQLKQNKFIGLMKSLLITTSEELEIQSETAIDFFENCGRLLMLTAREPMYSTQVKWCNTVIAIILDFMELFESRGIAFAELEGKFSISDFAKKLGNYLNKANLQLINVTQNEIVEWGYLLRTRKSFSNYTQETVEAIIKKIILGIIDRKLIGRDLHRFYITLSDMLNVIEKDQKDFDRSGVEGLFEEAIINSLKHLMDINSRSDYQIDLNDIARWSPALEFAFVKIASEKLPVINTSLSAHEVMFKMLDWKPFIPLLHLARQSPKTEAYFQEPFWIVRESFKQVFEELECGNVSFTFYSKLFGLSTVFKNICMMMLQVKAEDIESKMQKCNSLCKSIQSSFEKIVKLKELINKLRTQNIEIDMKELERSTEDWQNKPLKKFAEIDRRGNVTLIVPSLLDSELTSLETFTSYMKSRIFSKMTFKEVQRSCLDENHLCTYKQLLNELLAAVRSKYLRVAGSLASGDIIAETAQRRFKQYRENEKKEEIHFMFEFLTESVNDEKNKDELKAVKDVRMVQVLKLDTLRKNKDFVQALLDLKEVLGIENHFAVLDTLSKLVGVSSLVI